MQLKTHFMRIFKPSRQDTNVLHSISHDSIHKFLFTYYVKVNSHWHIFITRTIFTTLAGKCHLIYIVDLSDICDRLIKS